VNGAYLTIFLPRSYCHTNQSISQNIYSSPSRYLLRGAPEPGQAGKNSLEKVVEFRTGAVWVVS